MEKLKQLQQGLSFPDSDSGESDVETKDVDESSHSRLLDDISTLGGSRRLTHSLRSVHGQTMSESGMPSQGVEADRVMSDLMGSLQKSASHGVIKKQLSSAFKTGKVVDTPAPRHLKQKIQRTVGYETAVKEISKWDPIVTANRKAPQLKFPMEQPTTKLVNAHLVFRPVTALETEMAALLSQVKPEDRIQKGKVFTPAEERAMAAMSLEEAKAKRIELLQKRQIMYSRNSKLRWQNKIKSKRYRRAKKKEKEQKSEKEMEELALTDPQAVMDRLEESDKKRILERGRLRHAGGKKFAREARIFAKYDDEKRQQLQDMLSKHRTLKKKNEVVLSSSDSEDDDANDDGPNMWVKPRLWPAPASMVTAGEGTPIPTPTTTTTATATTISIPSPREDEETAQPPVKKLRLWPALASTVTAVEVTTTPTTTAQPAAQEPQETDHGEGEEEEEEESVAEMKNDSKPLAAKDAPERDTGEDGDQSTELVAGSEQHDGKKAGRTAGEKSQKPSKNRASAPGTSQPAEEAWQKKGDKKKKKKKRKKGKSNKEPEPGSPRQKDQGAAEASEQKPTNESSSQKPATNESSSQKPATNESSSQKPATNESSSQKPATNESSSQKPATNESSSQKPATNESSSQKPAPNESSSQKPATNESSAREAVLISIGEAFDDDDVVADFVEEKEQWLEEEREKDVDTFLPGWGRWAGAGIRQPAQIRKKFIVKAASTAREDNKIGNVVFTKKKNAQIEKHKAEKLPYQYKSLQHMKKGLSAPLGQYSCKPRTVVTRIGQIIQPLQETVLLQAQKRKASDINLTTRKTSRNKRH